jgi:2-polyprenyl-3-methyl-5-hydroxy-6-metoxy-1,4-benzoquinol methylase
MDAFARLPVTAIEPHPIRARDLMAVRRGGIDHLTVREEDARVTTLDDDSADVVTVLEVLEHLRDPHRLATRAVELARRFVVASVPSKPDDNPEHIQLFTPSTLEALLFDAGATSVDITHVRGHMIAVARTG